MPVKFTSLPSTAVPPERPGQVGGKRDRNRRERVNQLCRAALAIFLEQGVGGATIDDITQRAGVAKGSFYRYFEGKEELVITLFEPMAQSFRQAFERCGEALASATNREDASSAYTHMGQELSAALLATPDVVRLYLQENRGPAVGARAPISQLAKEVATGAVALTEVAHSHGLLRPFPAPVSALAVVGAVERLILATLNGEGIERPDRLPEQVTALVMEGLGVR